MYQSLVNLKLKVRPTDAKIVILFSFRFTDLNNVEHDTKRGQVGTLCLATWIPTKRWENISLSQVLQFMPL